MDELLSKIFAITSFVAAAMTIVAIVVAVIVILCTWLRKAKDPASDGGEVITNKEAKELLTKLFPLAVKICLSVFEGGFTDEKTKSQ